MRSAWVLVFMLGACASAGHREPPAAAPASTPVKEGPAATPQASRDTLVRRDVVKTVDAGLGVFLQRVDVEPSLRDGVFRGFRIVALRPPEYWEGVDLRPGDIVTQVNGRPIETEMQAFAVFQSLKTAPRLRVSYIRDGRTRELVYRIVETGVPRKLVPKAASSRALGPSG